MIEKVSKRITYNLIKSKTIPASDYELYKYGVELLISSFVGIALILITGWLFFSIFDSLIFIFCFITLRSFCGGFHANSYLKCNISSVCTFIIVSIASKFIVLNTISLTLVSCMCIFIISIFSPIENEFKPINDNERIKYKIISIIICTIFVCIALILHYYQIVISNSILFSTLAISFLVIVGKITSKKRKGENHESTINTHSKSSI